MCFCVYMCTRSYMDMLQRVKELCRYMPGLEGDTRSRCCSQVVICAALVLFRSSFLYVSAVQPALFQGQLQYLNTRVVLYFIPLTQVLQGMHSFSTSASVIA